MCTHRELHHSFFIYYGHGTRENCAIHTNPPANALKWYMAWLANNGIKVTWSTKDRLYTMTRTGRWEKCVVGGNLTVMESRPPNPLSQRRNQTVLWWGEERIHSWRLLPSQNEPLWWVCVPLLQQSAVVTQHRWLLEQGQEETDKGMRYENEHKKINFKSGKLLSKFQPPSF